MHGPVCVCTEFIRSSKTIAPALVKHCPAIEALLLVCVCAVPYHAVLCCAAGMASVALVLSILVPSVGNWWYLLTLLSPAAWVYYFQKGERVEQVGSLA
jgi:hypothetical protein